VQTDPFGPSNANHAAGLRLAAQVTNQRTNRVQHVTGDGRMRIIVYLMMRSDLR
jgi:hypothetical protein